MSASEEDCPCCTDETVDMDSAVVGAFHIGNVTQGDGAVLLCEGHLALLLDLRAFIAKKMGEGA